MTKITTWKAYGPDLPMLADETTNKILNIPKAGPMKGDVVQIVTKLSPEEFTRNWNKYHWKSSYNNLLRIQEAESQ